LRTQFHPGSPKPIRGKVLRVMRRQPDGSLKFARDIAFTEGKDSATTVSQPRE
jgi:ketosteroid isomerase-like protein